jgi:hypothetical protein
VASGSGLAAMTMRLAGLAPAATAGMEATVSSTCTSRVVLGTARVRGCGNMPTVREGRCISAMAGCQPTTWVAPQLGADAVAHHSLKNPTCSYEILCWWPACFQICGETRSTPWTRRSRLGGSRPSMRSCGRASRLSSKPLRMQRGSQRLTCTRGLHDYILATARDALTMFVFSPVDLDL